MSATPPEANPEYSRGVRVSRRPSFGVRGALPSAPAAILAAGLVGALALIVAEFTTLYSVSAAARSIVVIQRTTAGAHNAYAMVPIGLLAALLAFTVYRTGSRPALLALAALGVVAVLIATVGDLPDTHAHGLAAAHGVQGRYVLATASPGPGLYLETLGGAMLLLTGGLGLAALGPDRSQAVPTY